MKIIDKFFGNPQDRENFRREMRNRRLVTEFPWLWAVCASAFEGKLIYFDLNIRAYHIRSMRDEGFRMLEKYAAIVPKTRHQTDFTRMWFHFEREDSLARRSASVVPVEVGENEPWKMCWQKTILAGWGTCLLENICVVAGGDIAIFHFKSAELSCRLVR